VIGTIYSVVAALGGALGAVLSRQAYAVAHAGSQHVDGGSAAFQRVVAGLFVGAFGLLIVKRRELRIQATAALQHVIARNAAFRRQRPIESASLSAPVIASWKKKWRGVWPWVLANSLAGQTIGVSFMQWALESTPTGIVLAIIAVTPIVVIPLTFAFEGERPPPHSLVGGAIAVAGVACLILSR